MNGEVIILFLDNNYFFLSQKYVFQQKINNIIILIRKFTIKQHIL